MPSSFKSLTVNDTGSLTLPTGTTSNRTAISPTVTSFTTTGSTTWTCPSGVTSVEVLVVAGGGGGGRWGGGGGAGGLIYNSAYSVTPSTVYTVIVGAGGAGWAGDAQAGGQASSGNNSQFDTLIAVGGGGGGNYGQSGTPGTGANGGSGGGGGSNGPAYNGRINAGGSGTLGQGFSGGSGSGYYQSTGYSGYSGSGGGGGAGGVGRDSSTGLPLGGSGIFFTISGSLTAYAGGGGGMSQINSSIIPGGVGGGGGGGGGSSATLTSAQVDGVANTGGGGGGTQDSTISSVWRAGNGGSGIVILRYTASLTPSGQSRFNSDYTNNLEVFTANVWKQTPTLLGETGIVTNGLICHLDANKFTGSSWTDLSGNGNHFTLYNSPTNSAGAFTFNGTTQYARSTNTLNLSSYNSVTVEIIFQQTSWNSMGMLFEHTANWNTQTGGFGLSPSSSGSGTAPTLCHTNHNTELAKDYPFSCGTQYTIHTNVFSKVADSHGRVTYVNGQFTQFNNTNGYTSSTATSSGGSFANDYLYLATRGGTTAFSACNIAAVRIYNRKLTAAEVRQNYNVTCGRFNLPYSHPTAIGSSAETAASGTAALRAAGITQSGTYWLCPPGGSGIPFQAYCIMGRDGDWVKVAQFNNATSLATTQQVNANGDWKNLEVNLAAGKIATADWTALQQNNTFLMRVTGGSDNLFRYGAGCAKLQYFGNLTPYGTDLDPTASWTLSLDLSCKGSYEYSASYTNDTRTRCNATTNYWFSDHNYNGAFAANGTPPYNSIPICWTIGTDRVITNLHWLSGYATQSSASTSWGADSGSAFAIYVK
jgi:hypothetical protein